MGLSPSHLKRKYFVGAIRLGGFQWILFLFFISRRDEAGGVGGGWGKTLFKWEPPAELSPAGCAGGR